MQPFESTFMLFSQPIGLVPGPAHFQEPLYSIAVYEAIPFYPAAAVATTLSNLPGIRCIAQPAITTADDWYDWKWLWQHDDRQIAIDFTIFETDDGVYWGGSHLMPACTCLDLLDFWQTIQDHYPAVWLHDADCQLLTHHSFLAKHALPRLQPAIASSDATVRRWATAISTEYQKRNDRANHVDTPPR